MYEMLLAVTSCYRSSHTEAPFSSADIIHPLLPANLQGTIMEDSGRSHLHHWAK